MASISANVSARLAATGHLGVDAKFCFRRSGGEVKVRLGQRPRKRVRDQRRRLTSRTWGVSMERRIAEIDRRGGWTAYFALADPTTPFI
jgi:hypothetical protein